MNHPGYSDNKESLLKRLKRIEGQVRGIEKMIEDDRYCIDVLDQISSINAALKSVAVLMLSDHLSHCVSSAIKNGGEEASLKLAEATRSIERLISK